MNNHIDPHQAAIIANYNDTHREKFNPKLFDRKDEDIIEAVKKVILSCQRTAHTVIRVASFDVITDYDEVIRILQAYESQRIKRPQKEINIYNYINLKDSDIYLLRVHYIVKASDGTMELPVYIALPRIVNKYYFHISGNDYYAMYQIVDNSTYNNSMAVSSKRQSVTLKTIFMPIRIYRKLANLHLRNGEVVKSVYYSSIIFKKEIPALKYILGKLGYRDALTFTGYGDVISVVDNLTPRGPNDDQLYYFFSTPAKDITFKVARVVFDGDYVLQSFVHSLVTAITPSTVPFDIFTKDFWVMSLGGDYKNATLKKGEAVLDSLESIYDVMTCNDIALPYEKKQSVYHVVLWMMREFTRLRLKDNLNLSFKKIRLAEYIALLYSNKLSRGIYSIADAGSSTTLERVRKALNIAPTTLLYLLAKSNLVSYKNAVNDLDSTYALKCTYKGISGIGDTNNGKSVPSVYRMIHASQMGRLDLDTSSNTDPGMSGILCPYTEVYDGNRFSDTPEPNEWDKEFAELLQAFKSMTNLTEVIEMEKRIIHIENPVRVQMAEESMRIIDGFMRPIRMIVNNQGFELTDEIPLEESGRITLNYN